MKEIITDFSFGELSQKIDGRVDLPAYRKGAAELFNMYVMQQGVAGNMPGTRYIGETKTAGKKVRLISFELSAGTAYVLEFGHNYIRYYKDGERVMDGASIVETVTGYGEEDLFELKYVQVDKVLYIAHPSYRLQTLTYTSSTSWGIADVTFASGSVEFTTADNYPGVVSFYGGRLILASTNNNPQTIWGSKVFHYDDFVLGVDDADAWAYPLGTIKYNRILWIVSGETLIVGTTGGETIVFAEGGITPTSVEIKQLSSFGSKNIQGLQVGLSILFVQKAGRKVREFAYQSIEGSLASPDLTLLAEHITESGIVDFDYQNDPVGCAWFVRDDGYLIGLTYDRLTQTMAWHRHWISGVVESVAVIPGNKQDVVYVSVKRTVAGSIVRYVEYFTDYDETVQRDWFYLHSGITVDNGEGKVITGASQTDPVVITAVTHGFDTDDYVRITGVKGMAELNGQIFRIIKLTNDTFSLKTENNVSVDGTGFNPYTSGGEAELVISTVTGLDHLEGKEVAILADGGTQSNQVVSGGEITLIRKANRINAGLPYESRIRTMRLLPEAIGQKKRISKLFIRFYKSLGCKVGQSLDNLEEIGFREGELDLSAPPVFTGDKEKEIIEGYNLDGQLYLIQDYPLPMNISALAIDYQVYGGGR